MSTLCLECIAQNPIGASTTRRQPRRHRATPGLKFALGGTNSFTNIKVLLADGTAPISEVKVCEKVTATDPYRQVTAARPVVRMIRHDSWHAMAAIMLVTGAVIQATSQHPIWDVTTYRFSYDADLRQATSCWSPVARRSPSARSGITGPT